MSCLQPLSMTIRSKIPHRPFCVALAGLLWVAATESGTRWLFVKGRLKPLSGFESVTVASGMAAPELSVMLPESVALAVLPWARRFSVAPKLTRSTMPALINRLHHSFPNGLFMRCACM